MWQHQCSKIIFDIGLVHWWRVYVKSHTLCFYTYLGKEYTLEGISWKAYHQNNKKLIFANATRQTRTDEQQKNDKQKLSKCLFDYGAAANLFFIPLLHLLHQKSTFIFHLSYQITNCLCYDLIYTPWNLAFHYPKSVWVFIMSVLFGITLQCLITTFVAP